MNEQGLFMDLVKLIAPPEVVNNFDFTEIQETSKNILLVFTEKKDQVPQELKGKEVVLDGYLNKLELQTFPLKDKSVFIVIRRRRWKEKGSKKPGISNDYKLHEEGIKTTKEFGAFLKEELGLQPDEYNKLWKSLTD
ncbi:MAG: hypothetical protein RBR40_15650 [Tenuifilaceae bacterium]|jgi:hypothetical protein|nr:hypothetical protein [Tenuifilaceae bacterium]